MSTVYDVIVIGSGPSGLAGAIYLSRAKLKTLMLAGEKAGGQLMLTTEVENFPGFSNGIMGPELMMEMRKQAIKFGTEIKDVFVTKVDLTSKVKKVWVKDEVYESKTVLLTTGAKARMLGVGEERLLGRGVSTCGTCDAAFFKDKEVFQVGGGDVAMEDVIALRKFTDKVTLIHRRDSLKASKIMQERVLNELKVPVLWNSEVVGVKGDKFLESITIKNTVTGETKELSAQGLFIAIGHLPDTDFLGDMVEMDDHKYIVTRMVKSGVDVRKEYLEGYPTMTSVDGVFAAGDVVDFHYRQAITASGMGVMASLDIEKYLHGSFSSW